MQRTLPTNNNGDLRRDRRCCLHLERVMGIDSSADKPNSLNHLPAEAGAENGSQDGSSGSEKRSVWA